MISEFLYTDRGKTTYFEERGKCCLSSKTIAMKYRKIEFDVRLATDINELKKIYEIKILDNKTKLLELKFDKIRVIHFLYENDIFVYLGTFIKKSKKTQPEIIATNNKRIEKYKEQKNEQIK